jgi:1-deoxy-D-xylulose-5-phosphate reductoisomerase
MSNPDMRVPIAHALSDENRLNINFRELDFDNLSLSFSAFPKSRKMMEDLAREVCKIKNGSGIVFNAANEVAVDAFLNSKIKFLEIFDVILRTFDNVQLSKELDIEKIYEIDKASRIMAKKVVESTSN